MVVADVERGSVSYIAETLNLLPVAHVSIRVYVTVLGVCVP